MTLSSLILLACTAEGLLCSVLFVLTPAPVLLCAWLSVPVHVHSHSGSTVPSQLHRSYHATDVLASHIGVQHIDKEHPQNVKQFELLLLDDVTLWLCCVCAHLLSVAGMPQSLKSAQ